ncbi:MAG TPA: trehalose-6-phosphate synthase [Vicinamibacteria bacterium]|nr:trehalose-6-phosphate synthase [Vicinamibacteria bacterium]
MDGYRDRFLVVSNRLPVVFEKKNARWKAKPGSGGLVTALTPVLRERCGAWVGWAGMPGAIDPEIQRALREAARELGLTLWPVPLDREEIQDFYRGFSNEVLWPLFHDLLAKCNFDPRYWRMYCQVNRKVAEVVARSSREGDFVWIQDYHFLRAGAELRRRGVANRLGFFLHVPFPAPDLFLRLPWRQQILDALLQFDLVGFQTRHDLQNFIGCVEELTQETEIEESGGSVVEVRARAIHAGQSGRDTFRSTRAGDFPISIDYRRFAALAKSEQVAAISNRLENELGGLRILLGVDRLDYTKGLLHKLRGFRAALGRFPELRQNVCFVQHVIPSRECVPHYRSLRLELERLVGEVNGAFGTASWVPVRYFYHNLSREELSAYYRIADALLVTSLKDGMNLVAKEFCASNIGEKGVLVLSEFAGAACELGEDALTVNPYDVVGLASTIQRALTMGAAERKRRMARLKNIVREKNVFHWVDSYLRAAVEPRRYLDRDLTIETYGTRTLAAPTS